MALFKLLLFLVPGTANAASACDVWFRDLGLKPGSSQCEIKCASASTDMSSFSCPDRCEDFCKQKICQIDKYWLDKLSSPPDPFSSLEGNERKAVENALSRLPTGLRPLKLKAIVKASGSSPLTGPSPATSSDEYIILFPKAFVRPSELPRVLAHEASHFLFENEWASRLSEFKRISGWQSRGNRRYREGEFVESDGKFSPEEDFANALEYYLFEPLKLKQKSPVIFNWLKKTLRNTLELREGCSNGKL